jgi:hypothetical protein
MTLLRALLPEYKYSWWRRNARVPAQLYMPGDLIQSLAWNCKAREQLPALPVNTELSWKPFSWRDNCVGALAFTHPTYSFFTFSTPLVPRKVCGNESRSLENEQSQSRMCELS